MWLVLAMAVAVAQDDALRSENIRLARENEDLQVRILEARYRQGRSVRTAEMATGQTAEELLESLRQRHASVNERLRDGDLSDPAERARLKRLSHAYESLMSRLDPGVTPERLEDLVARSRRAALPINRNARLKAERRRHQSELMGLLLGSHSRPMRGL